MDSQPISVDLSGGEDETPTPQPRPNVGQSQSLSSVATTSTAPAARALDAATRAFNEAGALWRATRDVPNRPLRVLRGREVPFAIAEMLGWLRYLALRVRMLWGFFEWTRADYMRAGIIGGVTFVLLMALVAIPWVASHADDAGNVSSSAPAKPD
jgi:hypothetical protein